MDDEPDLVKDITVQHLILAREGRTDESWQTRSNRLYHLRGVGYRYVVDPDVEFPTSSKPPWAVYLRVTGWNAGPSRLLLRFHYQNPRGEWEHIDRRDTDIVIPFPDEGVETHELILQLPYMRFEGIGQHAMTAHFWYDGVDLGEPGTTEWTESEDVFRTPDWVLRGTEYFWVERSS